METAIFAETSDNCQIPMHPVPFIQVYYRFRKSPTLYPIVNYMNPVHTHTPNSYKINFNIILTSIPRSRN
jgi:hypothetical protein